MLIEDYVREPVPGCLSRSLTPPRFVSPHVGRRSFPGRLTWTRVISAACFFLMSVAGPEVQMLNPEVGFVLNNGHRQPSLACPISAQYRKFRGATLRRM